ncbi:uncharacterized protein [Euwallacea fornicatus]|uniref:uncharacterized protein n=1 Tax=Euwallacea fornicatus TaxID=995702 RepID=UPI00338E5A6C
MVKMSKIREITLLAKEGKFSQALELCNETNLVTETAVKVIHAISCACYYRTETCEVNCLEKLCNKVVQNIHTVECINVNDYFASVYHITKMVCLMKRYEDLVKLKPLLLPTFYKNAAATTVYSNIVQLIAYNICLLAKAKDKKQNKHLIDILKIVLKLQNLSGNVEELCSFAHKYYYQLHALEVSSDQLLKFYCIVLDIVALKCAKTTCNSTTQVALVSIYSDILSSLIESKKFEFCEEFLMAVETRITQQLKDQNLQSSHAIFKTVLTLLPTKLEQIEKNADAIKSLLNSYKSSNKKLFTQIFPFIESPLRSLLVYYKNEGFHCWCEMTPKALLYILKYFTEDLVPGVVISETQKSCSCGCAIARNYSGALRIGNALTSLIKSYISKTNIANSSFFSILSNSLQYYFDLVKPLKQKECQGWTHDCKELLTNTYNIGVVLFQQKNEAHQVVNICFLRNIFTIWYISGFEEDEWRYPVTCIFKALCDADLKNENFIHCMGLAALYCLLYTKDSSSFMQSWWIVPKSKLKDSINANDLTIVRVLQQQSKELCNIVNIDPLFTQEKQVELTLFELNLYNSVWRSRTSMMATFSHLTQIADIETVAYLAILRIYVRGDIRIHEDMCLLFPTVIKKMEKVLAKDSSNSLLKVAIAVTYFYYFQAVFKGIADRNLQEMEKTKLALHKAKSYEKTEPVPKNANDECDIVSAYSGLRLSKLIDTLELLNLSRDLISSVSDENFTDNYITKNISVLLISMGFTYRLHYISMSSILCFAMALKWAEKAGDSSLQLSILGFIIESSDVKSDLIDSFVSKGDELVKLLETEELHSRTLAIYHICKSKAFLYVDPKKSYKSWQIAHGLYLANKEKDEFKILNTDLNIVLYKLTRNCAFIEAEHEREPMTFKLHMAFDTALAITKKIPPSGYDLSILFDAVYELAKTYKLMRLPRDLRAYSGNLVDLAQQLVLPLRCVSLLILLAHSDLFTGNMDNCTAKLNGIDDILCINTVKPGVAPTENIMIQDERKDLEKQVNECSDLIEELMLTGPKHYRQFSPSSPTLTVHGFKYPEFLSHNKTCQCLMCHSLEFQQLLLQKYHLNALVNMHYKDDKVSEEIITGCLAIYDTLQRTYKDKRSDMIPASFLPQFDDVFLEPYANILYDYSFHLSRTGRLSERLEVNSLLMHVLRPKKTKLVWLYQDALLQRAGYIMFDKEQDNIKLLKHDACALQVTSENFPTTPVSKTVPVTVMVNGLPHYSPPRRRKPQKCIFPDSPDEKPVTKGKTANKTVDSSTLVIPKKKSSKACTTPMSVAPFLIPLATPKIPIFSDDRPKTRSYGKQSNKKQRATTSESDATQEDIADLKCKKQPSKSVGDFDSLGTTQTGIVKAGSSSKMSTAPLLTKKIKENTTSKRLKKNINLELELPSEVPSEATSSSNGNSIVLDTPEKEANTAKRALVLKKLRSSVNKREVKTAGSK